MKKLYFIIGTTVLGAILFGVFLLCAHLCILHSMAGSQQKRAAQKPPAQQVVTGAKAWALGCSAMLMERNHARHDTLAAVEITPENVAAMKQLLRDWWGVNNRKELLEALEWLDEQGGHRKDFDRIGKSIAYITEHQFQERLAQCRYDMDKQQELIIARKYYLQLGDKSIKGWDYTRYVAMCRWGYAAGYIAEDQAWKKIMPVARKLQKTFDSWEELGNNYLIGRQFWSYEQTQASGGLFTAAFDRLMSDAESPWNKYPWNMDLDSAE